MSPGVSKEVLEILDIASGKLDVGIGTYSYHNLTLDNMIAQLKALNISKIEMSRGEFMLMNHPGDDLFHSVRAKLIAPGFAAFPITVRRSKTIRISRMRCASRRFWECRISAAMQPAASLAASISAAREKV